MADCFSLIEHEQLKGHWGLGEVFSDSDIYLLTIARWLESDKVNLYPGCWNTGHLC